MVHFQSLIVALLLASTAHAVRLTLHSGGRAKCLTRDLRGDAESVARYRVADGHGDGVASQKHKICIMVLDPKGKSIRQVESTEYAEVAFLAKRNGRYTACFWSPGLNGSATTSIDVEWSGSTGNATQRWHSIARKMQAQMPGVESSKQPLQGPNASLGEKAYESTENKSTAAAAANGAEGEADDDDDNEDGGKGDKD